MLLSELMKNVVVDPNYEGIVTNDDNVLAVNISGSADAEVDTYAVVQNAIEGVDPQLNALTVDKTYLRAGQSTTKTGTQRTFAVTGDRYIGDDFQDFAFDHSRKYGTGQQVVTEYVWFNMFSGKGEKGSVAVIVNSDGGGNAGETAAIDIMLQKTGGTPAEYDYEAATSGQG